MKNLHVLTIVVVISFFLAGCTGRSVAEAETRSFEGPSPKAALAQAAEYYKNRGDLGNARKAVAALDAARDPENRNFEVEWTFASYSYFLGSRKETPDSEAEAVLKKGLSAARIAKRMQPDRPEGHFWYAAILGEQSKRSPVTVGIVSVDDIRDSMKKVIEIDPAYQGASAYDGLGQVEMGTRGLAGGSVEKAVEYFEKALEISPDNSYTRLHLGEAYLALGKKAEARKQLQQVVDKEVSPGFEAEHNEAVREAKKLLDSKF